MALIVNGLYFISLFTPAQPHTQPRLFARSRGDSAVGRTPKGAPVYATLPPPSAPSEAAALISKDFDQLDIYLTNDLVLVGRPGHRLLLSPTFTTRASKPQAPDSVLLRFISHSNERTFSNTTPMVITADGVDLWDEGTHLWYGGGTVPSGEGSTVVEGVGVEVPYRVFVEIISARQVIVQFGPDRVELTADQIKALRDMHRRLPRIDYMLPPVKRQ